MTDRGRFAVDQTGDCTIVVRGPRGDTGDYSFIVHTGREADISGDCQVDFADILLVPGGWGTPDGDGTSDGLTDFADILAVLADWG